MEKKLSLKKFLATASVFAMISASSTGAMGEKEVIVTGVDGSSNIVDPVILTTVVKDGVKNGLNDDFVNGDSLNNPHNKNMTTREDNLTIDGITASNGDFVVENNNIVSTDHIGMDTVVKSGNLSMPNHDILRNATVSGSATLEARDIKNYLTSSSSANITVRDVDGVSVQGDGEVTVRNVGGDNVNLYNNTGHLNIKDGGVIHSAVHNNSAYHEQGILNFQGSGNMGGGRGVYIGSDGSALKEVNANGDGKSTIEASLATDKLHHAATFWLNSANTEFVFKDDANRNAPVNISGAVDSSISVNDGGERKITLGGNGGITGKVGATNAITTISHEGAKDTKFTFESDVNAKKLKIAKGTVALDATKGTINLTSDIEFTSADAADSQGTLSVKGVNTVNMAGNIAQDTSDRGTIEVDTIFVVKGKVGDVDTDNALNNLIIKNDKAARYSGISATIPANVHINNVALNSKQAEITLESKNGQFRFDKVDALKDGFGTIYLEDYATLLANGRKETNIGSLDKKIKELSLLRSKTLTIGADKEDKINIYIKKLRGYIWDSHARGDSDDVGSLLFKGQSTFHADDQHNSIHAIALDEGSKVTITSPKTKIGGGDTTIGKDAELTITGNYSSDSAIVAGTDGSGVLKFKNDKDIEISAGVPSNAGNSLETIEFANVAGDTNSSNITFKNRVHHKGGIKFTGQLGSTITFEKQVDLSQASFTNDSATGATPTYAFYDTTNLNGKFSDDAAKPINFDIAKGSYIELDGEHKNASGTNFFGKGSLSIFTDGMKINSVGKANEAMSILAIGNNAAITKGVNVDATYILTGKTGTIGGTVQGTDLALQRGATLKIMDGATLKVTPYDVGKHEDKLPAPALAIAMDESTANVEFVGGATVSTDLGKETHSLNKVSFSDDANSRVDFNAANIYAKTTELNKGQFALKQDVTTHGETKLNNANIELGSKSLTSKGALIFSGDTVVTINVDADNYNRDVIIAKDGVSYGGKIKVTSLDDINLKNGETAVIPIIKNLGKKIVDGGKSEFDSAEIFPVKGFNLWSPLYEDNWFKAQVKREVEISLTKIFKEQGYKITDKNIKALGNNKVDVLLEKLHKADRDDKIVEATDRLVKDVVTEISDQIEQNVANVSVGLNNRLAGLEMHHNSHHAYEEDSVYGISSGDDCDSRYGVWFTPFYNQTMQKKRKGESGYKSSVAGATIGFDTKVRDDMVLGLAISASNTDMKYKNTHSGSKTKIDSMSFSAYAMKQFCNDAFVTGSATVGTNKVKNQIKRVSSVTEYQEAKSKYSAMSFNAELLAGYSYRLPEATVTPMGGLRYTRINNTGFTESGANNQNLVVSNRASNRLDAVLGAKASLAEFDVSGIKVTPEAKAFVNYDLINKNGKKSITLDGAAIDPNSYKSSRVTYVVGLGLHAHDGMIESGIDYDLQLADKRIGHQGSLMLRVNF